LGYRAYPYDLPRIVLSCQWIAKDSVGQETPEFTGFSCTDKDFCAIAQKSKVCPEPDSNLTVSC
jgi:hypothetical protein